MRRTGRTTMIITNAVSLALKTGLAPIEDHHKGTIKQAEEMAKKAVKVLKALGIKEANYFDIDGKGNFFIKVPPIDRGDTRFENIKEVSKEMDRGLFPKHIIVMDKPNKDLFQSSHTIQGSFKNLDKPEWLNEYQSELWVVGGRHFHFIWKEDE